MASSSFPSVERPERPAVERALSKPNLDKAVLEYLGACGLGEESLQRLQRELVELEPSPEPTDCKLTRLFKYSVDGSMEVAVSRLSGETDKFEVSQWTTVRELKELIEDRLAIPVSEQQLLRCGRQLKNDAECLAGNRVTFSSATLELLRVEVQEPQDENLEIFLTRASNIPEGSIVSIRAGHSRRQAPLNYDQAFKFPLKRDAANPFKVNVYSQFGKARLVLRNSEDVYIAQIEGEDGVSVGTLEFEVKDSASQERSRRRPASQPSQVAVKAKKSVQVSRYLDEHGLIEYMQSLIQSVMHEQPADPYQYMIRQLQAAIVARGSSSNSTLENPVEVADASVRDPSVARAEGESVGVEARIAEVTQPEQREGAVHMMAAAPAG